MAEQQSAMQQLKEIPKYQSLEEKLNCKECNIRRNCHRDINSKIECLKISNRIEIMQVIILTSIEVAGIAAVFLLTKRFWLSFILAVLIFLVVMATDSLIEKLSWAISHKRENARRSKYEESVKKIKAENDVIVRAANGETEEYDQFKNHIKTLMKALRDAQNKVLKEAKYKSTHERDRVDQKFSEVLENLEELNKKISVHVHEAGYVQAFYVVHLPALIANTNQYIELDQQNKLTDKQIVEFGNLLNVFSKKIASLEDYIKTQEEEEFIRNMKALNQTVLPDEDGSE